MKRDVTVGPSLAESHLTILQAVSAKHKQPQGQSYGWAAAQTLPALQAAPQLSEPRTSVQTLPFTLVSPLPPYTPKPRPTSSPSPTRCYAERLNPSRVLPRSIVCSLSSE